MERKYIALDELLKFPIRIDHYDEEHGNVHFVYGIESVLEWAQDLPAADVQEVRHGTWIDTEAFDFHYQPIYKCSVCEGEVADGYISGHKYCLHCGARMVD